MLTCSHTGSSWKESARNDEDDERNQGRDSTPVQANKKACRDQGSERDGDIDWDKGGLLEQMLTSSLPMENELRELWALFVHTFLFSEETEVMKCLSRTRRAYQARVEAIKSRQYDNAEARQEALAAHAPPSVSVMLEVLVMMVGDASAELPDSVKGPLREAMSVYHAAEMVGICRTQKAFSKPG